MRFMAAIHGINLDEENENQSLITPDAQQSVPQAAPARGGMMFKAPGAYDDMTDEERKKETQRMMGMHKQWAANKVKAMGT